MKWSWKMYVKLLFAKILHPLTKSWIREVGKEGTIMPRQVVIMYQSRRVW